MIFGIFAYLITISVVLLLFNNRQIKYKPIPLPKINKSGIVFYSNDYHRIKIDQAKVLKVDNIVYLKRLNRMIVLKNVTNLQIEGDFLYFQAKGKVEILFNCKYIYKYFNIKVQTPKIDVERLKTMAIYGILDNLFDLTKSNAFIRYLKLIRVVFNINILNNKIIIKSNRFKIPFKLTYKINNTIKKINVIETF